MMFPHEGVSPKRSIPTRVMRGPTWDLGCDCWVPVSDLRPTSRQARKWAGQQPCFCSPCPAARTSLQVRRHRLARSCLARRRLLSLTWPHVASVGTALHPSIARSDASFPPQFFQPAHAVPFTWTFWWCGAMKGPDGRGSGHGFASPVV